MYFIGVTTRHSSINRVFPLWSRELGLGDCELSGMDFPLHDRPEHYRAAVEFIKRDPLSLGALVTTHKIDLFTACQDQFDEIDPLTRALGEVGSIFKRNGQLHGRAVDPWTSGHALSAFLPENHWRTGAEVLILGAGGAGTALTWRLCQAASEADRPARIHVVDRASQRIGHVKRLCAEWPGGTRVDFHHADTPSLSTDVVARLPAGSLVVNATGMGKDTAGSPLSDAVVFPQRGLVWEFNYRGDLVFLAQAQRQRSSRGLHIEDGWVYFLHGWTTVISDVFQHEIPTAGPQFEELGRIAAAARTQ